MLKRREDREADDRAHSQGAVTAAAAHSRSATTPWL
jgi:hypothetical protein